MADTANATRFDRRFDRVVGRGRGLSERSREHPRPPVSAPGGLPIYSYLDISNAHLSEEEEGLLCSSEGVYDLLPRHIPHEYGAWMNVPEASDDEDGEKRARLYPNIQAVIEFARRHHCTWVNFDCDAEAVAELPTF